jgi:iron complex outermembrane receptor protein
MRISGFLCVALTVGAILFATTVFAADTSTSSSPPDPEFDKILSLDINDLNVTSVSKQEEKLSDTPAAIYVITQNDLRRTGATSIPDALRMVPGLEVARVSAHSWAISARGFNGALANKLLVMIDGRSIYTPVFSGTYWDDQSTPIQDIDRIEVIRGPGASLWGANAVDGVINVITKSAEETQGNLVSATGSLNGGLLEGRHGGKLDDNTYYRTYATLQDSGSTQDPAHDSNHDDWDRVRAGFRLDKKLPEGDSYTLQGDAYGGNQDERYVLPTPTSPFSETGDDTDTSYGANILGRWNHKVSDTSDLSVQAYVDHYSRLEEDAQQHVSTADVQVQNSVRLDDRNKFIWGGGARVYLDDLEGSFAISASHTLATHEIVNTFVQDEYAVVPDKLYLTLGSKFEYNDFSGFEVEPSVRTAWHPTTNQTVWGAVSRAVRTPSSIEEDVSVAAGVIPGSGGSPPTELRLVGNPDQESEELIAYELGHRIQLSKKVSFDTALYWNDFDKLQTIATAGPTYTADDGNLVQPYAVDNLGSGHVYGAEFAANWKVTPDWKLMGSYTFTKMDLDEKPGTVPTLDAADELAPRNQFSIRSYLDLTETVHWDNMVYYVDHLSAPVDAYVRYDTRLAWLAMPGVELSLIGRNLTDERHPEFPTTPQAEVGRTVVGQVVWKF